MVAFPGGKLAQYKPDLKLAKTIPCTIQLLANPFLPIAIQWLSTFQFAVAFLEQKEEQSPGKFQRKIKPIVVFIVNNEFLLPVLALFIVNAPKNVQPTYINYDDICYSQSGPRFSQLFLQHLLPW